MATDRVRAFAPAKINLALHVTGKRADGYHLLDSLVVFAAVGDQIRCEPAPRLTLTVLGPFGDDVPMGEDNLVLRAARLLDPDGGADITLFKELPPASGIGGGSSDAAATLQALSELWQKPLPSTEALLSLGADLPVCLLQEAVRMQGIGDRLTKLAAPLPPAWLVLANPGGPLSTREVFGQLRAHEFPPLPPVIPTFATLTDMVAFLRDQRNDLELPAMDLMPEAAEVPFLLEERPGCLMARMSGSGATSFGIFATEDDASYAEQSLRRQRGHWWIASGPLLP